MREAVKIQQKTTKNSSYILLFLAFAILGNAFFAPKETAALLFQTAKRYAEYIFPSLFAFAVGSRLLVRAGFCEIMKKIGADRVFSRFSLSAQGLLFLLLGLVSGFPMGASVLADGVLSGELERDEAERLLPFANNASASFVIGMAGLAVLGSESVGRLLFFSQTASALLGAFLFSSPRKREEAVCKRDAEKTPFSAVSVLTGAVSEGALSMVMIGGYVVFFTMAERLIWGGNGLKTPRNGVIAALISGFLELSGGFSTLQGVVLTPFRTLFVCSLMLGFGGLCTLFQVAGQAARAGISMRRYLSGKLFMMPTTVGFSWLFVFLSQKKGGGMMIFVVFVLIFCVGGIKNKIFFKKTMEKRKGMRYNRYEIHCP